MNIILGTAGHIDHGKTTLIKALTGVDLDRLKEEKERGITIELGFTYLLLPGNQRIGIVDVPGHEKFIKRMIAGAGGIDLVLLVVAADDGVMPQTKEHLEICQLLNIKSGLIALTKIDLVEPEWVELVKEDIRNLVRGTFLDNAPIVPVSAITREGLPELISNLAELVRRIKLEQPEGICFLPVDRVFTIKGFGTVITGTLISGEIGLGETLEVLPQRLITKVRGIQVHNSPVGIARAGERTAINLQGIEKELLKRGDILSRPQELTPSFRFDVRLKVLPDALQPIRHGDEVRFHIFTTQTFTRVIGYDKNVFEPGGEYFAQLRFSEPMVTIPGARFIIRSIDARQTIGGGEILDSSPPKHKRNDPKTSEWFKIIQARSPEKVLEILAISNKFQGITPNEIRRRISFSRAEIENSWQKLQQAKILVEINPDTNQAVHSQVLQEAEEKLKTILEEFHKNYPLKIGIPMEEARQRLGPGISEEFFKYLINQMKLKSEIGISGIMIHQAAHKLCLNSKEAKLKAELEQLVDSSGLTPPTVRELAAKFLVSEEEIKNLMELLVNEEKMIKVKDELYFSKDKIIRLKDRLIEFFCQKKELTPSEFKELTGATRKHAIPLLEYFDKEKVTLRKGDVRILREKF